MRKIATLDPSGQFLKIRFLPDQQIIRSVRSLKGGNYNSKSKFWLALACKDNLQKLQEWGFYLDPACKEALEPKLTNKKPPKDFSVPGLKHPLFPFQREGVYLLNLANGRALLADEPRLGKTIQALGWLQLRQETALPALIMCTASTKINWLKETQKFTNLQAQILDGRGPQKVEAMVVIANYDILPCTAVCGACRGRKKAGDGNKCRACKGTGKEVTLRPDLAHYKFRTVICDEAHHLANKTTQKVRALHKVIRSAQHFIPITATPVDGKPIKFFNLLNLLNRKEFSNYENYTQRYCGAKLGPFGLDVSGATNLEELNGKLQDIMIRRYRKDVFPELPEKTLLVVPLEISNASEYKKADTNFTEWVRQNHGRAAHDAAVRAEALVKTNYLMKLAALGKLKNTIGWVEDLLEAVSKVVLFVHHTEMLTLLMDKLKAYNPVKLDGSDSPKRREAAKDRFQTDPKCRVFIGNIEAAGEGIELSASHNFIFLEYGWKPRAHTQASERGLSVNQSSQKYNVWNLVATGTIDEDMIEILDYKQKVNEAIIDGKEMEEKSMLSMLLKKRLEGGR